MCNKVNAHLINIYILFTCAHLFMFKTFLIFSAWNYSMCLKNFKHSVFETLKQCRSRKAKDHTPNQGNWLVAWSQSVRMPHQRTCKGWICSAIVRSKSVKLLSFKWSVALTWSVQMLECHTKGGRFLSQHKTCNISLTFWLWFLLSLWNYFTKILSTPNVKAQEHDSRCKYSMINKTLRSTSTQWEGKKTSEHEKILVFLR